jgi:hypothetical protein
VRDGRKADGVKNAGAASGALNNMLRLLGGAQK